MLFVRKSGLLFDRPFATISIGLVPMVATDVVITDLVITDVVIIDVVITDLV